MVTWVFQGVPRLSIIVPGVSGVSRMFQTVSMAFRGLQGFSGVFQGVSGRFSCIKDAPECFQCLSGGIRSIPRDFGGFEGRLKDLPGAL